MQRSTIAITALLLTLAFPASAADIRVFTDRGVADAWGLGVAKVPAVVVDRRYVIYGEPDVALALSRIARYRREQP